MADELERMKAELLEAGYKLTQYEDNWDVVVKIDSPDFWAFEFRVYGGDSEMTVKENTKLILEKAIRKAYAHLTEKRQNEAMRELLEELANFDESVAKLYTKSQHFERFIEVARRILGKE